MPLCQVRVLFYTATWKSLVQIGYRTLEIWVCTFPRFTPIVACFLLKFHQKIHLMSPNQPIMRAEGTRTAANSFTNMFRRVLRSHECFTAQKECFLHDFGLIRTPGKWTFPAKNELSTARIGIKLGETVRQSVLRTFTLLFHLFQSVFYQIEDFPSFFRSKNVAGQRVAF